MRLRALDGEIWGINQPPPDSLNFEAGITSLRAVMGKTFYAKVKDQSLQLSGTLYFTLYGNKQQTILPINNGPVPVRGIGLCSADTRFLLCHSAFRPPSNWVTIHTLQNSPDGTNASTDGFSHAASYSPFPADLNVDPLFTSFSPHVSAILQASIEAWEPLAHIERNFEFNHVRLNDFAASSPLAAIK